jgi:hypothetical protein
VISRFDPIPKLPPSNDIATEVNFERRTREICDAPLMIVCEGAGEIQRKIEYYEICCGTVCCVADMGEKRHSDE